MLSSAVTTIYHNCLTETKTGEQVFLCTFKKCDHDHMTIMWHNNWTTYIYILIWIIPIKCIKPIYIYIYKYVTKRGDNCNRSVNMYIFNKYSIRPTQQHHDVKF